jgi:hypothetical protein
MCPICEDWTGKNVELSLCERCRLQSEVMYEEVSINVGTDKEPVFKLLKEIIERKLS